MNVNQKGCNTVLEPRGSPCPIHRNHEHPRVKSLNDNVVHGDIKGGEGKKVYDNKTSITQKDKKDASRTDVSSSIQRQ